MPRASALVLCAAFLLAACGSSRVAGQSSPSTSSPPSASPSVSYTPIPQVTPASSDEMQAMIAVARQPAERDLKLGDEQGCSDHHECLFFNLPPDRVWARVGVKAAILHAPEGCPDGCGGSGCFIFLYQDGGAWHYVNARCTQATGYTPGPQDRVFVDGCANFRDEPYKNAHVLGCAPNGSTVDVDSAPVYSDSSIWWHLAGKGWMVHDFLVAPPGTP